MAAKVIKAPAICRMELMSGRLRVSGFGRAWAALLSPLSSERTTNRHQLLNNLAFTHLTVVNSRLTIQSKRCAAKRSALACIKEMPP